MFTIYTAEISGPQDFQTFAEETYASVSRSESRVRDEIASLVDDLSLTDIPCLDAGGNVSPFALAA